MPAECKATQDAQALYFVVHGAGDSLHAFCQADEVGFKF
jgi:hypothetical protein